jgi:hypothetical protein
VEAGPAGTLACIRRRACATPTIQGTSICCPARSAASHCPRHAPATNEAHQQRVQCAVQENGKTGAAASGTTPTPPSSRLTAVPAALPVPTARPDAAAPCEDAGPGSPATWEAGTVSEDHESGDGPQPLYPDNAAAGPRGLHDGAVSTSPGGAFASSVSAARVNARSLPAPPPPIGEASQHGHKRPRGQDSGPGRGRGRGKQQRAGPAGEGRAAAPGGAATSTSSLQVKGCVLRQNNLIETTNNIRSCKQCTRCTVHSHFRSMLPVQHPCMARPCLLRAIWCPGCQCQGVLFYGMCR